MRFQDLGLEPVGGLSMHPMLPSVTPSALASSVYLAPQLAQQMLNPFVQLPIPCLAMHHQQALIADVADCPSVSSDSCEVTIASCSDGEPDSTTQDKPTAQHRKQVE